MPNDFVIYHNPRCSKSRQALELLRQHGHEPVVIEYLKTPPDLATLRSFGIPAAELFREDATGKTDAEIFAAIVRDPSLLQRPVVVHGKRALVARPPERVKELW